MAENEHSLIPDYPGADGTDAAHPAYWRGHEDGSLSFMSWVNEILDHRGRDESRGFYSNPKVKEFRLRLAKLRDANILESPFAWHDTPYGERGPY